MKEIEFYVGFDYAKVYPYNEHIQYLQKRIGIDRKLTGSAKVSDNKGNDLVLRKMDFVELGKEMNIRVYQKEWNKLKAIHKQLKIRDFCDKLKYKDINKESVEKNRKKISKKLVDGLTTKRFVKGKSVVTYDKDQMKIKKISCLSKDKKGAVCY